MPFPACFNGLRHSIIYDIICQLPIRSRPWLAFRNNCCDINVTSPFCTRRASNDFILPNLKLALLEEPTQAALMGLFVLIEIFKCVVKNVPFDRFLRLFVITQFTTQLGRWPVMIISISKKIFSSKIICKTMM